MGGIVMKKLLSIMVVVVMVHIIMLFPISAENNEIRVCLDATQIEFDVKPQIINGRTMVPIRAIFEKMGAVVEWDGNTNSAICTKGDTIVKMTVNSMDMYINNQLTKMDVCPVVIDGRTLAPTRYVAEAFGANVQWSQKNNMVVICSKDVYAYADYPDIPDLGRCYNIPLLNERTQNGYKVLSYTYSDMSNDDYYGYLYDNTALILGNYSEESIDYTDGVVTIAYTKAGEIMPRYFIGTSYDENGAMIFSVIIPNETGMENKVTLYALDGRTIEVLENEVPAYLNVGWYKSMQETQQTLYATDGRTVTVFKSEVPAYKNVGWYESQSEAQAANQTIYFNDSSDINNPEPDGYYYRTPTGKRYHLDPNCGGKNSYRTTNISGLSPCAKCAK